MDKVIGFIHIYAVNNYKEIVDNQVKLIFDSGLYQACDIIYYAVIGKEGFEREEDYSLIQDEKYHLLHHSNDMTLHESFTLNGVRRIAKALEYDFKLFYIHTKGVTRQKKSIELWRMFLEYFTINCWLHCVDALNQADVAGVNRRIYGKRRVHFSGNFWWANSSYIRTLPELSLEGYGREPNRWDAEFWIGDGNPTLVQLWNSRVHHQLTQYGPDNYQGKSPQMYFFDKFNDS